MYTQERNSGIVTGSNKPRRPRIIKWVNIKDVKPVNIIPVDIRLKKLYKELNMSSVDILNNKLKLAK